MLPWLGGLALISWLGSYPDPSVQAGNRGVLGLDSAIPVIALFSALIMALAQRRRLPGARVHDHLREAQFEAEPEP